MITWFEKFNLLFIIFVQWLVILKSKEQRLTEIVLLLTPKQHLNPLTYLYSEKNEHRSDDK